MASSKDGAHLLRLGDYRDLACTDAVLHAVDDRLKVWERAGAQLGPDALAVKHNLEGG